MNLNQFQLLAPLTQLFYVLRHGLLLASRPQPGASLDLYVLADPEPQFYVEVESRLENGRRRSVVCGSFPHSAAELPQGWH